MKELAEWFGLELARIAVDERVTPGKTTPHEPETDKSFLFSHSPGDPFGPSLLLMNGIPQPSTLQLKTGTKYRLRFMNITPSVANLRVSLKQGGECR